jgi:hypothetical protein
MCLIARCRALRIATVAASVAVAAVCAGGSAIADDAADVGAARKLGQEGVKLADAGKCGEAVDRLARAEILHHAPTILGRLGECQIALGRIVEGTESLQRVVREPLPPNPPPAFVAARKRAQKALDTALPRIAHLTIEVKTKGAEVKIKVDNEPVSSAMIGASRPTDPGTHTVEASAPDFLGLTKTVTLSEGESATLALSLEPDTSAKKKQEEPKPKPDKPAASHSTKRTLGYVSLAIGGVGVVMGSAFGLMAMSKRNALDKSCQAKICPTSEQDNLDAARLQGTVSTVGFVVGGIGLAAGATLLLWPSAAEVKAGGATIRPWTGFGSAGVSGAF